MLNLRYIKEGIEIIFRYGDTIEVFCDKTSQDESILSIRPVSDLSDDDSIKLLDLGWFYKKDKNLWCITRFYGRELSGIEKFRENY